ncbi:MAG TPA: hypothetical protein V6D14_05850 [Coleofasciculaceae cyanobacterium]
MMFLGWQFRSSWLTAWISGILLTNDYRLSLDSHDSRLERSRKLTYSASALRLRRILSTIADSQFIQTT